MIFFNSVNKNKTTLLSEYAKCKHPKAFAKEKTANLGIQKSTLMPYRFDVLDYISFLLKENFFFVKDRIYKNLFTYIFSAYSMTLIYIIAGFVVYLFFVITGLLQLLNLLTTGILVLITIAIMYVINRSISYYISNPLRDYDEIIDNIRNNHEAYMDQLIINIDLRYQDVLNPNFKNDIKKLSGMIIDNLGGKIFDFIAKVVPTFLQLILLLTLQLASKVSGLWDSLINYIKTYLDKLFDSCFSSGYMRYNISELPTSALIALFAKMQLVYLLIYTMLSISTFLDILITGLILIQHKGNFKESTEAPIEKQFNLLTTELHNLKDCQILYESIKKLKESAVKQQNNANYFEYIGLFVSLLICTVIIILSTVFVRYYFAGMAKEKEATITRIKRTFIDLSESSFGNIIKQIFMLIYPVLNYNINVSKGSFIYAIKEAAVFAEIYFTRFFFGAALVLTVILLAAKLITVQDAKSTLKYLLELKELVFNIGRKSRIEKIAGIKFKNASIRHKPDLGPTLTDLNLDIVEGKVYILVGPSGAGKSTFINAIIGRKFITPSNSVSCFDGSRLTVYENLDNRSIEQIIGYVSQNAVLPDNPTVADLFKNDNVTVPKIEMESILQTVCMEDWLYTGNDAYSTPLGDGGANLSGGQRRRIAIGSLLAQRKSLNIIDEALDSLDNKVMEHIVHNVLCDLIIPIDIREDFMFDEQPSTEFLEENILQRKIFFLITHRATEVIAAIKKYFKKYGISLNYLDKYYSILSFEGGTIKEIPVSVYKET